MLKLYPRSVTDVVLTACSAAVELTLLVKLAKRRGWSFAQPSPTARKG